MTRPADPRGADRRAPSEFGAETGYDTASNAPAKPRRLPFRQRREIPDCGCHGYEVRGVMYTRCERHAPAGGRWVSRVKGQCPVCVTETA